MRTKAAVSARRRSETAINWSKLRPLARWMARAWSADNSTSVPRKSTTTISLPSPFILATGKRVCSWIDPEILTSSRQCESAGALVDHPRAKTRERFAQILGIDRRGLFARQLSGPGARQRGFWRRFDLPVKRPLAKGDLADASPAQMRIDALDENGGRMLRFEGERALDPQHQRRHARRRSRIAPDGARP